MAEILFQISSFLDKYGTQVLYMFKFIARPGAISFIALGFVYAAGKMLNRVKRPTSKNALALVVILAGNLFYGMLLMPQKELVWLIADQVLHFALAIVIYVCFCMKLYDRMDVLQDKLAEDPAFNVDAENRKVKRKASPKKKPTTSKTPKKGR